MIDASHVKVHQHGTGAVGGNQAIGRTKGGMNTKLYLAVDAHGVPARMLAMAGMAAGCMRTEAPIDGADAEYLLAYRWHDTNGVLAAARERGKWRR